MSRKKTKREGNILYQINEILNTVHCMDCLDFMKSMPDKCIDLVLTDPPYGIGDKFKSGLNSKMNFKEIVNIGWDVKPDKIYFDEIFRISKNQIIWGGNYFELPPSRCFLVWDKKIPEDFSLAMCEQAWCSFDKNAKIIKLKNQKKEHPTQKPVALFQWILQNYSQPGMTIFDPFAGSGTTAIACLETGRNYILVEKEPEYVKIINDRIDAWKKCQTKPFFEKKKVEISNTKKFL